MIAYNQVEALAGDPGGHFRVHLIRPDGTGDFAVAGPSDPNVQEAWPLYSPDGRSILVHRWTWKDPARNGVGWLALLPADGGRAARDIGPRIPGGEDSGLVKAWSPDGTRILARTDNTQELFSIDPATGTYEKLPWSSIDLPDTRRMAP